jgi:hypothetical protein
LLGLLAAAATVSSLSGSQSIVENPAKAKAANAGRVVVPKEVLPISDEGTSDYYFKWPRGLRTSPDGSLVLLDENQVLRFDQGGRFRGNLLKKGQGPGEVNYPVAGLATAMNTIIISSHPNKIVFFDLEGKFEKEITVRQEGRTSLSVLLYHGGNFFFRAWDFPRTNGDPDIVETPQTVVAVSEATGEVRSLATFMTKSWVVSSSGGGGGMFDVTNLIAVPFRAVLLALTHTEDYLIKIYDPAANKVLREIRRPYERISPKPLTEEQKKGGVIIDGKRYGPPERKYQNDIRNLFVRGEEIWAVTSTSDKKRGILIDVFDGEGVYRDCFWLKLPEPALASIVSPGQSVLDGEFLWVVERAEDETFSIKKYRVVI